MIILCCFDIENRRATHNYFRDKGVLLETVAPSDLLSACRSADVDCVLIAGTTPPGFVQSLPAGIMIISIGRYQLADSFHFRDIEDPKLLEMLIELSGGEHGFQYGELLYADSKEIIYLGYVLDLTSTERAMLHTLIVNHGKDVSSEQLAATAVGDIYVKRATVSKHISEINRKARLIGGRTIILSPSKGYYRIRQYI